MIPRAVRRSTSTPRPASTLDGSGEAQGGLSPIRGEVQNAAAMAADGAEQRKFARIEASLLCSVATANDAFDAAVVNLSKSGAAILGPDGAAKVGDTLTLLIERQEGLVSLALPGEVVRIEERGE